MSPRVVRTWEPISPHSLVMDCSSEVDPKGRPTWQVEMAPEGAIFRTSREGGGYRYFACWDGTYSVLKNYAKHRTKPHLVFFKGDKATGTETNGPGWYKLPQMTEAAEESLPDIDLPTPTPSSIYPPALLQTLVERIEQIERTCAVKNIEHDALLKRIDELEKANTMKEERIRQLEDSAATAIADISTTLFDRPAAPARRGSLQEGMQTPDLTAKLFKLNSEQVAQLVRKVTKLEGEVTALTTSTRDLDKRVEERVDKAVANAKGLVMAEVESRTNATWGSIWAYVGSTLAEERETRRKEVTAEIEGTKLHLDERITAVDKTVSESISSENSGVAMVAGGLVELQGIVEDLKGRLEELKEETEKKQVEAVGAVTSKHEAMDGALQSFRGEALQCQEDLNKLSVSVNNLVVTRSEDAEANDTAALAAAAELRSKLDLLAKGIEDISSLKVALSELEKTVSADINNTLRVSEALTTNTARLDTIDTRLEQLDASTASSSKTFSFAVKNVESSLKAKIAGLEKTKGQVNQLTKQITIVTELQTSLARVEGEVQTQKTSINGVREMGATVQALQVQVNTLCDKGDELDVARKGGDERLEALEAKAQRIERLVEVERKRTEREEKMATQGRATINLRLGEIEKLLAKVETAQLQAARDLADSPVMEQLMRDIAAVHESLGDLQKYQDTQQEQLAKQLTVWVRGLEGENGILRDELKTLERRVGRGERRMATLEDELSGATQVTEDEKNKRRMLQRRLRGAENSVEYLEKKLPAAQTDAEVQVLWKTVFGKDIAPSRDDGGHTIEGLEQAEVILGLDSIVRKLEGEVDSLLMRTEELQRAEATTAKDLAQIEHELKKPSFFANGMKMVAERWGQTPVGGETSET